MNLFKRLFLMFFLSVFLLLSFGCSSEKEETEDPGENSDQQIQQDVLKSNRQTDESIRSDIQDGSYTAQKPLLVKNPYDISPLTAIIGFQTDEEASITLTIEGDRKEDTLQYEFETGKEHILPVIGLYPDRENKVTLTLAYDNGESKTFEHTIETEPLPDFLADMVQDVKVNDVRTEGLTLVSGGFTRNPFAFDSSGVIRWFLKVETDAHGYFPADNGRFFLVGGYNMIETESRDYATDLFDLDYLGRFHKKYQIEGGIHHEVVEKEPGGNLFVHGSSLDGHVEDIVLEIDRDSGERLRVFDLTEHFDDTRYTDAYDWAHMNSISYNRKENTMLLSARNVSSVIKIDWETEEILWILSDPKVWEDTPYAHLVLEPIGEPLWHYEQHAAFEIHEDIDQNPKTLDLMLFDNRVIRNELMDLSIEKQEDQSSVVQYAINEEDFTVEEKKRFSNSMAFITSNFEIYPALDLLMANHGSLRKSTDDPIDSMWGEIYEVDYSSKEILNTYALKHGFYRAHKIYPDAKASAAPMK